MDAGSMIMQERIDIGEDENAVTLLERLSRSGAELMLKALEAIEAGKEELREQDENEVVLAPKLEKDEGRIDWTGSAAEIIRKIRGMQPWPGAFSYLEGRMLKILEAETGNAEDSSGTPGTVCDEKKFIVHTGKGTICVNVLQLEGKKSMTSDEFLRGYHLKKGTILGA
jgi:methionyl-tRNA formyltransferase